ncbi:MAG TPA: hypothetical protein VF414_13410 [Thermoanaerobaculia bacterium]
MNGLLSLPGSIFRSFLILSLAACMAAPSVTAQTFVKTILDAPPAEDPEDVVSPARIEETLARDPNLVLPLSTGAEAAYDEIKEKRTASLTATIREELTAAVVDQKLARLASLKDKAEFDKEFEETCKEVAPVLENNFLPALWNSGRSACFWGQSGLDALRAARLTGTSDQGTAALELASDIFWGLRVKIQASVTASEDDDEETEDSEKAEETEAETNLQQLLASGGNLSLSAMYPWYAHKSSSGKVQALFTSFVRVGGIIPALGEDEDSSTVEEDDVNASLELGLLEADARIDSFRGNITFVVFGRAGLVDGTKKFHESISNEDEKLFAYGEIGAGVRLAESFWLLGSWKGYSADALPGGEFALTIGMGK